MRYVLACAWALACGNAFAEDKCQGPQFAAFDFWVGEWSVSTADGQVVGQNQIDRRDGGCVIVERWTSARGNTGTSLNYYDVARHQWVQLWGWLRG